MTTRSDVLIRGLPLLERGAAWLRRAGLGSVVDLVSTKTRQVAFEETVCGLILTGSSRSHLAYVREIKRGGRDRYLVDLLHAAAAPGSTVIDAGAYIGYLTLHAAFAVGTSGHVFSIEPHPETRDVLARNIELNGFGDRVEVIPVALGSRSGRGAFHASAAPDTSSLYEPPRGGSTPIEVTVETADALFVGRDVAVVKLDLEGGEVEALRGMTSLLARSHPILFVECSPEALAAAGSDVDELVMEITRAGYVVRWIDEEARALRSLNDAWPGEYVNLYCEAA